MQHLKEVLGNASMGNNTVILTTLNDAWASTNSVVDLFLKSFMLGDGTHWLLDHLVIIALDKKAYNRCQAVHKHCFSLVTGDVDFQEEAYFMTPNYLKMMWRRIDFLRSVLELGYDFVFTVFSFSLFGKLDIIILTKLVQFEIDLTVFILELMMLDI